jgi:hypothetical protein
VLVAAVGLLVVPLHAFVHPAKTRLRTHHAAERFARNPVRGPLDADRAPVGWYHVGSRDERPGRTGFAHLFEHMMFKGSKNVQPDSHTSMIARIGGRSNAYTQEDETVFWETLPSHYLPLALWLEADRMATLRVDRDASTRSARSSRKSGGCAWTISPTAA